MVPVHRKAPQAAAPPDTDGERPRPAPPLRQGRLATASDLEKLRRLYADWARGDYSNTEIFDPAVVGHTYGILPGDETEVQRVEELGPTVSAYLQSWERPFIVEALEFEQQGDRIAVGVRWKGRSKAGGAEIEAENAHLWSFREGKAVRFDVYGDRGEAMAALRKAPDDGGGVSAGGAPDGGGGRSDD